MFIFLSTKVCLWILFGIVCFSLFFWMLTYIVASYFVYTKTLSRGSKNNWSRDLPSSLDEFSLKMYDIGKKWHDKNIDYKKDVHIINEGLNLYGEYYDFGKKTCVMILSGRTESLRYGYYFAEAYSDKCNVLVIDPRAHGLSDGEYNTVGFEESKDILAWVKFVNQELKIDSIIFHGICIGAAGGMYTITNEECPDFVKAIITEGMFPNFGESMKNHLIEKKKPVFIFYNMVNGWMKHYTGHSMNFGPINVIDKLNKPLLMLHSKEDLYSTPEYAEKLFNLAKTKTKELVWFDHGAHSMIRINNTEKYDLAIKEFLERINIE